MNPEVEPEIGWVDWLRRWDAHQEAYVPERAGRFAAMFDALAELLPASCVAFDLETTLRECHSRTTRSARLHRRRRGSGRGAAALAIRQAEAEALIGGAISSTVPGQRGSGTDDGTSGPVGAVGRGALF
jgi:hypothetical protein